MESLADIASIRFGEGFNCAQAVLVPFAAKYGLEQALALRISGGLGCGLRCGEVCGAAVGGVLVVGLRYGQHQPTDTKSKQVCHQKTAEFMEEFGLRFGALRCEELLGHNPTTEEGRAAVIRLNLNDNVCEKLVRGAARILEEQGY